MAGYLLDTVARRCGHLDHAHNGLSLETARIEALRPCLFPTRPQEQIRQVAWRTPPVHEKEFVLEAHSANREPRALSIRDIALGVLLREGSVRSRVTINVRGICEHLRRVPFSSSGQSHLLAA